MNNEPVAYIGRQDLERLPHHDCWVNGQEHKNSVPLYTHPNEADLGIAEAIGFDKGYKAALAKTLTDDEFDNIFANGKRLGVLETEDKFRKAMNLTDEEIITVLTDKFVKDQGRYASTNLFYIEFARAILKKAQEADKIESLGTVNIGGVHFRNGKEVK